MYGLQVLPPILTLQLARFTFEDDRKKKVQDGIRLLEYLRVPLHPPAAATAATVTASATARAVAGSLDPIAAVVAASGREFWVCPAPDCREFASSQIFCPIHQTQKMNKGQNPSAASSGDAAGPDHATHVLFF